MLNLSSDAAWKKFGSIDPYYGVVSHDRFHAGRMDQEAYTDFFRSGEEHVASVLDRVRRHLAPAFRPDRMLDFGCGVGRLVVPLARLGGRVTGVDVSEGMLREAAANCERQGLSNVELVRSDDRLSAVQGTFDFVHSFIVFQHIPPARGMAIVRSLLARLEEGGVGALHFTYARRASLARRGVSWMRRTVPFANSVVNLAQGKPWAYPLMQMHSYDLNRLLELLNEHGCPETYLYQTDHGGYLGAMLFFRKSAAAGA
jgi:SAM-dependent methyltransferase